MTQMAADEMQLLVFDLVFICEHLRNLWLRILFGGFLSWKIWNRGFRGWRGWDKRFVFVRNVLAIRGSTQVTVWVREIAVAVFGDWTSPEIRQFRSLLPGESG